MNEYNDFRQPFETDPSQQAAASEAFTELVRAQLVRFAGATALRGEGVMTTETIELEGESLWGNLSFTVATGLSGNHLKVTAEDNTPLCDYNGGRKPRVLRNDRSAEGEDLLVSNIITNPGRAQELAADYMAARREAARHGFTSQPVSPEEIHALGQLLDGAKPTFKR